MRTADLAQALSAAGRLLLGSGDRDAAERAWDELDGIAAKSRDPRARLEALPNAATRALLDGDLEVAAAQLEADSRFVAAVGLDSVATSPYNCIASIRALYYLGQADDTLLDEFLGEPWAMMLELDCLGNSTSGDMVASHYSVASSTVIAICSRAGCLAQRRRPVGSTAEIPASCRWRRRWVPIIDPAR
jgi:hypothetical protein